MNIENQKKKLFETINHTQASENTKLFAIHAFVFLGFSKKLIAHVFAQHRNTIGKWIKRFLETGTVSRKQAAEVSTFHYDHKVFIKDLVDKDPFLKLAIISKKFKAQFSMSISVSTVFSILTNFWKYSRQKVELRAMEIRLGDINRYMEELYQIRPLHSQLLFIDEVSMDNRDMLNHVGWFMKGGTPYYRGYFQRTSRMSFLSFANVNGLFENFHTEGTFTRDVFFDCVRRLVLSKKICSYPGPNSVWIIDGARIHLDENIVYYLRSVGVKLIFLPAYCPFFNPIEYLFGYIKAKLKEIYGNESYGEEFKIVCDVFHQFSNFPMKDVFVKCGYSLTGFFDPRNLDWKSYDKNTKS